MSELIGASSDPGLPPGEIDSPGSAPPVDLRRATVGMALGTGLSRVTGVGRVLALAYALGLTHLADAYNLANNVPNMLYDVVLGGVLSATFIPVFVERLATREKRDAWQAISAVITLSIVVLVAGTVVFWLFAPFFITALTVLGHSSLSNHQLAQERAVGTSLLRWFLPQVALYGLIALATALLNTQRRFAAPAWVPIANNLVCIAVLLIFAAAVPSPSLGDTQLHGGQVILLGLGTTLGVAVQALLLLPSLRASLPSSRLRWHWDPRHEAVRTALRLGGWTFGFVVANQVALFIVLALAVGAGGRAPVAAYTYAYTFLQMPYAVVAVSVMNAVTPDLAESWTISDLEAFRRRMSFGLRAVLAVILPAALGMLLLARPAVALLLGHGATTPADTGQTGAALAMFAIGLPGFCTYLYVVRVLQAMQRTKMAFWLYLFENGINVVLALILLHPLGVRGLALSLSVAYALGAVAGLLVLRRWLGRLGTPGVWAPLGGVVVATIVMGAVVLVVSNLSGAQRGLGLLVRVGAAVLVGIVVFVAITALLARRRDGPGQFAVHGGGLGKLAVTGLTSIVIGPSPDRERSGLGSARPIARTANPSKREAQGSGEQQSEEVHRAPKALRPVGSAAPRVPGAPHDAPRRSRLVAHFREASTAHEPDREILVTGGEEEADAGLRSSVQGPENLAADDPGPRRLVSRWQEPQHHLSGPAHGTAPDDGAG